MDSDLTITFRNDAVADPWTLTLAGLAGEPWPALPELPGRRHVCADRGLTDEELAGCTSASELALCAGISRQAAHQRMQRQAALLDAEDGNTPD